MSDKTVFCSDAFSAVEDLITTEVQDDIDCEFALEAVDSITFDVIFAPVDDKTRPPFKDVRVRAIDINHEQPHLSRFAINTHLDEYRECACSDHTVRELWIALRHIN